MKSDSTECSNVHGVWSCGSESWGVLCLLRHDLAWKGELDLAVVELGDGRSAAVLSSDWGDLDKGFVSFKINGT